MWWNTDNIDRVRSDTADHTETTDEKVEILLCPLHQLSVYSDCHPSQQTVTENYESSAFAELRTDVIKQFNPTQNIDLFINTLAIHWLDELRVLDQIISLSDLSNIFIKIRVFID